MVHVPHVFYALVPLGCAVQGCVGVLNSSLVLQLLDLADHSPERVLLMRWILSFASPAALSGASLGIVLFGGSVVGSVAGKLGDQFGLTATCFAFVCLQIVGCLLTACTTTYILGMLVVSAGQNSAYPLFMAILTTQFEDPETTQNLTTLYYAISQVAFLTATTLAGVQRAWLSWLECAIASAIGLARLLPVAPSLRDVAAQPRTSQEQPAHKGGDLREHGFVVLCAFDLLFWAVFVQFLGGPFMVFAKQAVRPLGSFDIPAQWFLSLNGICDLCLAVPLAWAWGSLGGVPFHVKLRVGHIFMAAGCGVLSAASKLSPRGVSPLAAATSILLISVGELHYNPVMLAAIATDMPANRVGLFTGIHFLLYGVGGLLAGAGVPLYHAIGPKVFFGVAAVASAGGAFGLHLTAPFLARCFEADSQAERLPLVGPVPA
mmetsp:Transcript_104943/g.292286  ORF Transcript_104943/g.292286 Transcript_104943/m.292286 type:complete len:433 (+) Transcript_104943:97-1395(+)